MFLWVKLPFSPVLLEKELHVRMLGEARVPPPLAFRLRQAKLSMDTAAPSSRKPQLREGTCSSFPSSGRACCGKPQWAGLAVRWVRSGRLLHSCWVTCGHWAPKQVGCRGWCKCAHGSSSQAAVSQRPPRPLSSLHALCGLQAAAPQPLAQLGTAPISPHTSPRGCS